MPNHKSAAKRVRTIQKRTLRNTSLKSALRTSIRKFENAVSAGTPKEEIEQILRHTLVSIDKAVTKGILHKNTAARKKSRLVKRFNRTAG